MLNTYRRLLRTSRPVLLMTALVAIFGITGTAVAAKRLVTGADIKNGSITRVDLSRSAQDALRGKKGEAGVTGARGFKGASGAKGAKGSQGVGGVVGIGGAQGVPGNTGTTGPQGVPAVRYFAAVASDGTLSTSRVHGVIQSVLTGPGLYRVALSGAPDASSCVAMAQVTGVAGLAFAVPDGSGNVAVTTFGSNGVQNNRDFVLTISC